MAAERYQVKYNPCIKKISSGNWGGWGSPLPLQNNFSLYFYSIIRLQQICSSEGTKGQTTCRTACEWLT